MPLHHATSTTPKYSSKRRVADRYGKNARTITRWVANLEVGFPQPVMINGRWYFDDAEIDEFDRRLAAARLRDLGRRHQAEDEIKEAQCNLTRRHQADDKNKEAHCAGGEA